MMVQTEMTKLLLLLLTTGHEKRNREEDTKDRIEIGEVYTIHGWPSTVCGSTYFVRCFLIIEFTSKWCDLCVIGGKVLVSTSFVLSFCLCLLCSKWQSQYFTLETKKQGKKSFSSTIEKVTGFLLVVVVEVRN